MTRTPWTLARRSFLLGAGLTALAACSSPAGVSCPTSARVVNRPVVPGTGGRPRRPWPPSTSAHAVAGARPGPGSTARPVVPPPLTHISPPRPPPPRRLRRSP